MRGTYLINVLVHMTAENLDKLEREDPRRYAQFLSHFQRAASVLVAADVLPTAVAVGLLQATKDEQGYTVPLSGQALCRVSDLCPQCTNVTADLVDWPERNDEGIKLCRECGHLSVPDVRLRIAHALEKLAEKRK